jgi:hypothetical protein
MTLRLITFKKILGSNGSLSVRFRLPDGVMVAPHAHITEVGLVTKSFVDCGGTLRSEVKCQLQSWVADDVDHRLSAAKLLSIIDKASGILGREDHTVELEHDVGFATQFQVVGAEAIAGELVIQLAGRHTACLAPEKCCPPDQGASIVTLFKPKN